MNLQALFLLKKDILTGETSIPFAETTTPWFISSSSSSAPSSRRELKLSSRKHCLQIVRRFRNISERRWMEFENGRIYFMPDSERRFSVMLVTKKDYPVRVALAICVHILNQIEIEEFEVDSLPRAFQRQICQMMRLYDDPDSPVVEEDLRSIMRGIRVPRYFHDVHLLERGQTLEDLENEAEALDVGALLFSAQPQRKSLWTFSWCMVQ